MIDGPEIGPLQALGGPCPIPVECERDFLRDFDQNHRSTGIAYSDYAPAYEYGYRMAIENRQSTFEQVEDLLKQDFLKAHPNCNWEKMRAALSYGWRCAKARL